MSERSPDFQNDEQSRKIRPLTAAGLLLILVSTTALVTYGILTVPGVLAAKGGPPDEFLAAATAQAAQFTPTATGNTPTPSSEGSPGTPDGDAEGGSTATPVAQASTGGGSTGALPPSVRPTVNPYGDWPLPDWVDDRYWLSIPQIALEAPVIALAPDDRTVEGANVLRLPVPNSFSVAWDLTSAQPGFAGNTIMTGHSNFYGGVFGNLDSLTAGAEIAVWSEYGVFSYYVSGVHYIEENGQPLDVRLQNAQWLNDTVDDRITLITCWPTSTSSHRLVVVGTR